MAPWAMPIAMVLGSAASVWSNERQMDKQEKAQKDAETFYKQQSKPDPELMAATAAKRRGELSGAYQGAKSQIINRLGTSGFGLSGDTIAGRTAELDRAYVGALGEADTADKIFRNTPFFAPPGAAYPSSAGPGGVGTLGAMGEMMTGYGLARQFGEGDVFSNLFGGGEPTGMPGSGVRAGLAPNAMGTYQTIGMPDFGIQ
ncbi:hypothetical protein [Neptuniibacter sp.]|uniref:hypothetical protein n=1 Tax=Neptuniibacter sp. TaxID=1962643 RepID=UPI00261D9B8D|nr:hypothetical protein [Neptuniibacter sp.]MCP4597046.1 hypothetical protein [Neptuniibacter sp.]